MHFWTHRLERKVGSITLRSLHITENNLIEDVSKVTLGPRNRYLRLGLLSELVRYQGLLQLCSYTLQKLILPSHANTVNTTQKDGIEACKGKLN